MAPKPFLIGLLITITLNANLAAQDNGCTSRTVPVGVVDRGWNLVRGLSAANFRANLHGQEVKIISAAIDTSPRHIVLLLDASGTIPRRLRRRSSGRECVYSGSSCSMSFGCEHGRRRSSTDRTNFIP